MSLKCLIIYLTSKEEQFNTSIFGFTKTPHHPDDEVLFVNLKEDGFESIQHKGRVDVNNKWNDIENKILDIINNSKEEDGLSTKKKYTERKRTLLMN